MVKNVCFSGLAAGSRRRMAVSPAALLHPFHQIQIRQGPVVSVDASRTVVRDQNRADVFHSGGIGGEKLLPERSLSRGDVQTINFGRKLAGLVDIQPATGCAPTDDFLPGEKPGMGRGSPPATG